MFQMCLNKLTQCKIYPCGRLQSPMKGLANNNNNKFEVKELTMNY